MKALVIREFIYHLQDRSFGNGMVKDHSQGLVDLASFGDPDASPERRSYRLASTPVLEFANNPEERVSN
jgi:hypothetical protein